VKQPNNLLRYSLNYGAWQSITVDPDSQGADITITFAAGTSTLIFNLQSQNGNFATQSFCSNYTFTVTRPLDSSCKLESIRANDPSTNIDNLLFYYTPSTSPSLTKSLTTVSGSTNDFTLSYFQTVTGMNLTMKCTYALSKFQITAKSATTTTT
jgi:hypothetical protein